jgi:hypothetical protein
VSELTAQVRLVPMSDPAAAPLPAGLYLEYTSRYGRNDELTRYPESAKGSLAFVKDLRKIPVKRVGKVDYLERVIVHYRDE